MDPYTVRDFSQRLQFSAAQHRKVSRATRARAILDVIPRWTFRFKKPGKRAQRKILRCVRVIILHRVTIPSGRRDSTGSRRRRRCRRRLHWSPPFGCFTFVPAHWSPPLPLFPNWVSARFSTMRAPHQLPLCCLWSPIPTELGAGTLAQA